jgi:hypothetical protein
MYPLYVSLPDIRRLENTTKDVTYNRRSDPMKRRNSSFYVVLAVLSVVLGCGNNDNANIEEKQQRIVNGTTVPLPPPGKDNFFERRFVKIDACTTSGTLIRNEWVLTTGYCATTLRPSSITTFDGINFAVKESFRHPTQNVGLLHLSTRVPATCGFPTRTTTACRQTDFHLYPAENLVGEEVTCYGYGGGGTAGGYGTLRKAYLTISKVEGGRLVYFPNISGQVQGYGDEGGSCLYREAIIDTSFDFFTTTKPDGTRQSYVTSLPVEKFRDWVLETIGESTPRLGADSNVSSWVRVVAANERGVPNGRIWDGSWRHDDLPYAPGFDAMSGEPHQEIRWNAGKGQEEVFGLYNYGGPGIMASLVRGMMSVGTYVPTHYHYPSGYSSPDSRPVTSPAVVAMAHTGLTYLFYVTDQGELAANTRYDVTGSWSTPASLGGGPADRFTSQPAATVDATGRRLHLFARGASGQIKYNSFDGWVWTGWSDGFDGYLTSAPGAATVNGQVVFAARGGGRAPGVNGGIWYTKYTPGDPVGYGWKYIPGTEYATSGPGVTNFGNRTHVYYLNQKGEVCQVNEATAGKEDWVGPFCPIP